MRYKAQRWTHCEATTASQTPLVFFGFFHGHQHHPLTPPPLSGVPRLLYFAVVKRVCRCCQARHSSRGQLCHALSAANSSHGPGRSQLRLYAFQHFDAIFPRHHAVVVWHPHIQHRSLLLIILGLFRLLLHCLVFFPIPVHFTVVNLKNADKGRRAGLCDSPTAHQLSTHVTDQPSSSVNDSSDNIDNIANSNSSNRSAGVCSRGGTSHIVL